MGNCKHIAGLNIEVQSIFERFFFGLYYALIWVRGITIRLHEQTRNLGTVFKINNEYSISMLWGTAIIRFTF